MRYLSLGLLLLFATSASAGNFELMKCTSAKNGTLWASFGHLYRSGQDQPTYFPTEIVVFADGYSTRLNFNSIDDALKIGMVVDGGRIHLEFTAPTYDSAKNHLLQLILLDPRVPSAYMGNWTVSEPGKPDVMDLASCSAD